MRMGLLALLVVATAILAGTFGPARAQDESLRVDVASVSDGTYPDARAVVNIEDTGEGDAPDVTKDNFTVTIDGRDVEVVAAELATSEAAPLDAVFVVDTSGSMAGAAIESARNAAKALVAALGASDRVAVISFGDDVRLLQDYTSDRAAVNAAIDSLTAVGNTALYQATAVGALKAAESQAARRAVVLLSDGADFGGRSIATREQAITAAGAIGVPFFTIAQGSDLDREYLIQVAQASNGRFLEAPSPQDLESIYLTIGRLLRTQYVVTFNAASIGATAEATVQVTLRLGERTAQDSAVWRPAPTFVPEIFVSGIEEGDSLSEPREILVTVRDATAVQAVRFVLDGREVAQTAAQPFVFAFDPEQAGEGRHTLKVSVELGGAPLEREVRFSAVAPAPSDGGLPIVPIVAVTEIGGIAGVVFLLQRIRSRRAPDLPKIAPDQRMIPWAQAVRRSTVSAAPPPEEQPEPPAVQPESIGEPLGLLISRSGPDLGSEYLVGGSPVSIGSAERCGVRVDDAALSGEEARIWVRGGHLMVHKFVRLAVIAADGTSGGWLILEPGDTFEIGQHAFEFRLLPAGAALADEDEPAFDESDDEEDSGPPPSVIRDGSPLALVPPTADHEVADEPVRVAEPADDPAEDAGEPRSTLRLPNLMPRAD
jgi:VWFA-related protein